MKFTAWIERDGRPRQYEFLCYNPQASLLAWHGGNQLWIEPDRIRMTKLGCLEMIRDSLRDEYDRCAKIYEASMLDASREECRMISLRHK